MKTTTFQPHKSSLGMSANIAVLLVYIAMAVISWIPYLGWLAWAVPLVFFYMEKESKFVKFQSVQALIIGIIRAAVVVVFQIFIWVLTPKDLYGAMNYALGGGWGVWALLGTLSAIVGVVITLIEVYILVKAYGWKQVELPVIGPIAAKASAKLESVNIDQIINNNAKGKAACPVCGKENPSGTGFCGGCGAKLG